MAKAVRIVGTVVGAAVAVVGVLTLNPALIAAGVKIVGYANVAAGVIDMIKPPSFSAVGSPQNFQTNPQSGLPYAIGRTRMSGLRIYAETSRTPGYNKADDLLWFGVMLSAGGQIGGIEKFTADNELITFNPTTGAGNGRYNNWMAQKVWTGGLMASALALSLNGGSPPGWTSAHRLSGITHAMWGLRYDAKDGAYYSAGVPQPAWIGKWVLAYDPRKDSTYPGGSGSHRALNEATYEWTRNPALHALTWALGRWQNGKRTLGIGAPLANIRVSDFVEAANVADANGWGCGGVEYSTDSKWDVLKRMLQAGGAIPTMTGAMIGCRVNKPRISIATIRSADLLDEFSGAVTKPRRDRFNTVIPRYRSEDHEWEVISGKPISVPAYVTQDGGIRQKEIDYPLVQAEIGQGYDGNRQAGQLAAYDIVSSREAGPIKWTTGPKFIGLKTGDCVTLDVPGEGLVEQPVIITSVSLDPSTGKVSFTAETETNSKHAFALGTSAVPPPPFALTPPDLTPPAPDAADWTMAAAMTNDGLPLIRLGSSITNAALDRVLVQYRLAPSGDWTSAGSYPLTTPMRVDISGIDGNAAYAVRLAYQKANMIGPWTELAGTVSPFSDIRLNPRGSYASGATYLPGDVVVWDSGSGATGNSYKRIGTGATTNVAPSDTSKWALLAIRGQDGAAGLSIVELTIYRRAATAPATPSGGSYNFATKVLTPPSGWSSTWPSAGSDPVWAASGVASVAGLTGTVAPSWLGVGQAAANGADGQATNAIFRRAATQPATPAASAGAPSGWYDDTGSVPAGPDPIWVSFGARASSASNYVWQKPTRIEGQDGIPGAVPTLLADNVGGGSYTIVGDKITKTGSSGGTASVYSQEGYGSFYLRAIASAETASRVGVSRSAPTSAPTFRFAYSVSPTPDRIYHNGVIVWDGEIPVGAVVEMVGDGKVIRYYIDGALTYTGADPGGANPWQLCAWISPTGSSMEGIRFAPSGEAGRDGADAKVVNLTASSYVFLINEAGGNTPASITLSASGQNLTGSPTFTVSSGTATLTGTGASRTLTFANMATDQITVQVSWDGQTDFVTISKLRAGVNGISKVMSNEAHSLPASSSGAVSSYAGSGTTIQVYEGSTALTFHTTLAAGRFIVGTPVVSPAGAITVGARSGSGTTTCTVANHSAASNSEDRISITYPITARRADGTDVTFSCVQTLAKSKAGEDGISPLLITVNPPSLALQGNATGTPMAGQLPRSVQVTAMRGGLAKAVSSMSVAGTSGCSVSVSGANLTFTAVSPGGGFATINVTADGETISGIKVPVTVGVGGTDAATSLAMSYSGAVTSSTYVALGDPVAMNANASGQLRVSASSTYYATYPTIATLAIKLQVSVDGGAWTDIAGAEDIGVPTSVEPPSSTYPGAAVINPVLATGLGANKPCQVRMMIRKTTTPNASNSFSRLLVEKP